MTIAEIRAALTARGWTVHRDASEVVLTRGERGSGKLGIFSRGTTLDAMQRALAWANRVDGVT